MDWWLGKVVEVTGASAVIGAQIVSNLTNAGMIIIELTMTEVLAKNFGKKKLDLRIYFDVFYSKI